MTRTQTTITALIAAFVLVGFTTDPRGSLYTSFVSAPDGGHLNCTAANVTSRSVVVEISLLDGTGLPIAESGRITISAGHSAGVSGPTALSGRCVFQFKATRDALRGVLRVIDFSGANPALLAAF